MRFFVPVLIAVQLLSCNQTQPKENNHSLTNQLQSSRTVAKQEIQQQKAFAMIAKNWCTVHHYNTRFFFFVDMSLQSGKKRFFVYDIKADSAVDAGLVAHGCCSYRFLVKARFSNEPGCGCSSTGKYKIGGKYEGNYGTAYKLTGLDSSNSNAAKRNIVLHSYYSVPDQEVYPDAIGNSYGCVMVSQKFFKTVEQKIDSSAKPLLLWVVE